MSGEQGAPVLGLPPYVGLLELMDALAICMAIMESLLTLDIAGGGRTAIPGVDVIYMLKWVGEGTSDSDKLSASY